MSEGFRGAFPGGPGRRQPVPKRTGAPRLSAVRSIEERASHRSAARARRARTRRILWGLLLSTAVAGGVGGVLGYRSHRTAEQIVQEQQQVQQQNELTREVNRALMELWKMEDIEAARNMGRTR